MKVAGPGPCFDMAEWFGGVGGTDSTALAIEVNEIAYVMTQGSNDVVLHHRGDPDVCAPRTHTRARARGDLSARGHVIGCNSGVVHARASSARAANSCAAEGTLLRGGVRARACCRRVLNSRTKFWMWLGRDYVRLPQ